ncbi:hypothetical protein BBP40_010274 [Aspergillus hancockii]|nr:hypothetical protein BBP40_010274 [Aspergillus hancockii]
MPSFIVDGEPHRIPFMPFFRGYKFYGEGWFTANGKIEQRVKTTSKGSIWSAQDDETLIDLRGCNVPWKCISAAMNNKPVEVLKERWFSLRTGRSRSTEIVGRLTKKTANHYSSWEDGTGRHVSFTDPLATDDENIDKGYIASQPLKVFYLDDDLELEDVLLLHTIAAKWEKEKWFAVSTRFHDKTGRSITPEQAKSVIDF